MSGRYGGWRRLSGPTAEHPELFDRGKKLLAELDNQRRLSGVKTCSKQVTLPTGTVRAGFDYDLPYIDVQPAPQVQQTPVQPAVGGFVTWPTDETGATAIPESVRIILAGKQYVGVRESFYSRIFPDGLNRAGNVDWQGKGWVVSWYGPRTRYFESAPPLKTQVFAKGLPIADASELSSDGDVVLGACVCEAFGNPWLIVVSENMAFGRSEDVWCVRLLNADTLEPAKPTDTKYSVDADSVVFLDSRSNGDFVGMRHPWFFNPDGTEGRMLAEDEDGYLAERIIRILEDTDDESPTGFKVERDVVLRTVATQTEIAGYTAATWSAFMGEFVAERREIFDAAAHGVPTGTTAPGSPPQTHSGTFSTETTTGTWQAAPQGLSAYEYRRQISASEEWQPVAVDFNAAGEVVYGYGRQVSLLNTRAYSYQPTAALPTVESHYADNGWTVDSVAVGSGPDPAGWVHTITFNYADLLLSAWSATFAVDRNESEDAILGGVRVGTIDVLAERTNRDVRHGTYVVGAPARTDSGAADTSQGIDSESPFDPNDGAGGVLSPDLSYMQPAQTATITLSANISEAEETLYLAFMDLRYDALFTVVQRDTLAQETTRNMHWNALDDDFTDGTDHVVIASRNTRTWRVRGWIHGNPVLDETVTSQDDLDTSDTANPTPSGATLSAYADQTVYNTWIKDDLDAGGADYHGTVMGATPNAVSYLPIEHDNTELVSETLIPFQHLFTASVLTSPLKDSVFYQFQNDEFPIYQQLIQSWHNEVEASGTDIHGFSFGGSGDTSRVKVHWHYDVEGVGHCGSWAFYQAEWAFSMALPTKADDSPYLAVSLCRVGGIARQALTGDELDAGVVEHFYPIWVLPNSGRYLTSP